MLCQPISYKDKENPNNSYMTFIYRNRWFVLSQTEGEAVEPQQIPEWNHSLALSTLNITETPFDLLSGNVQGYAKARSISINPIAAIPHKTTFHELGHVLLGHTAEASFTDEDTTPRNLREVEAECVALICCEALNLPGSEYSRGYIQNWLQGDVIPEKSAQKIFGVADQIIKVGKPKEETDN